MTGVAGLRSKCLLALSALCLVSFLPISPLGAAAIEMPKPTARDKCPVCGMFVAKYPDWLAAVRFRDGSRVYFDGAKDMFKYLHDMKKYDPARKPADIQDVAVNDYYGLVWIDARKVWYVLGSDVYGPMGKELIPLEKEADAQEFMKDHKGTKIIRFSEATPEVIKPLD
ncbi:MAG: nitrous oxide reductase accessory protein NosL [Proteobacteria bacterium]|nr:nitrous oxide reductase accessory protein NosL [Pseudomonadota bacterium]